jgi:hypothetical protein
MTWIFHPLALGVLVAATTGAALYLMATVRVRVRSGAAGRERHLHAEIGELKKRMDELAARPHATAADLAQAGEGSDFESAPPGSPLRAGINLSRRSQALRLYRRGETPEQIAASLMVPTGEVRLLLKVHRLVMEQVTAGPHPALKSGAESADTFSRAPASMRSPESI